MNKTKITLFAGAAVIIAVGLILALRMNAPSSNNETRGAIGITPVTPTRELDPFTHVASVPATVDPATIRFEKLKMVDLASKTQTTKDAQDCKERQFRDPDGSNCETVKVIEKVKAVEADYSFIGPQTSTGEGEIAPTRQTFSVYFRPEEVGVSGPVDKLKRDQAAELFQISTSRPTVQQRVVDKDHSRYCDGHYVDGSWVQNDSKCQDQVQYVMRDVPSTYWSVAVDLKHPAMIGTR